MTHETPDLSKIAAADQAAAQTEAESRDQWNWDTHVRQAEAQADVIAAHAAYEKARGDLLGSITFAVYLATLGAAGYVVVLAARGVIRWFQ